jgi:cytochrome c
MTIRAITHPLALVAALAVSSSAFAQSDPGEMQFNQRCKLCHVVTTGGAPGPLAPNLRGVVGRKAASTAFKTYSPALTASKLVWSSANLDKFLTAPGKMVPGTRMVIAVSDAGQRKAIIAYLAKQK